MAHLLFCTLQVIQFNQLCSLLGGKGSASAILDTLKTCAVLVQGCWVAGSNLLFSEESEHVRVNNRDFIVS